MQRVVLIGGGGHCASVIDAVRSAGTSHIVGVVDSRPREGEGVLGVPIVGCDDDLPDLKAGGADSFIVTLGSVGDASDRERLHQLAVKAGLEPLTVIHAAAHVSPEASLEPGVFVGALSYVGPCSVIGEGAIINSGAIVDHDCVVGAFAHVAPGAVLSGGVRVGRAAHVGTGACVKQGIGIGERAVVGIGSVVVHDIRSHATAFGNPCREVVS